MSEELIIRHCAPTLAGMKTGSLFSYAPKNGEDVNAEIRRLNRMLGKKGLRVLPMRIKGNRALIYIYRPALLRRDFDCAEASEILEHCGYCSRHPEQCVAALMRRLRHCAQDTFPHEIGLFLGYPPEDVAGFIENRAGGCKCVGCWKVYGDVQKATSLFRTYKLCTDCYLTAWRHGRTVEQLAV